MCAEFEFCNETIQITKRIQYYFRGSVNSTLLRQKLLILLVLIFFSKSIPYFALCTCSIFSVVAEFLLIIVTTPISKYKLVLAQVYGGQWKCCMNKT